MSIHAERAVRAALAAGAEIGVVNGRLHVTGEIPPELRRDVFRHARDIIDSATGRAPLCIRCVRCRRLAICDGEGCVYEP